MKQHATPPFRVLRIIASYPSAVNIESYDDAHELPDIAANSPLAVLEGDALRANDPSDFLQFIVQTEQRRKRTREDMDGASQGGTQSGRGSKENRDDDNKDEAGSDYVPSPPRSRQR